MRLLAEAGVVIGQETRQQLIAGGDRADPLKTQFLDQTILQGLVGALDAALCLRRVGAQNVDVEGVRLPGRIGIELIFSLTGEAEAGSAGEQPAEE